MGDDIGRGDLLELREAVRATRERVRDTADGLCERARLACAAAERVRDASAAARRERLRHGRSRTAQST